MANTIDDEPIENVEYEADAQPLTEDEAFRWFTQGFIKALSIVERAEANGTLDDLLDEMREDIYKYRAIFEGEGDDD